jgi:outer membrane protein assembly factor BamB
MIIVSSESQYKLFVQSCKPRTLPVRFREHSSAFRTQPRPVLSGLRTDREVDLFFAWSIVIARFPALPIVYLLTIRTVVGCSLLIGVSAAHAQKQSGETTQNPIYIADSPTATDSLQRLPELLALNNLDEASRLVDQIITDLGDRLIKSDDPDIYIHVRDRLHDFVLNDPELLAVYRSQRSPPAQAWLDQGDWQRVARDAWLTKPGFIASLHQAQALIESAHFHAGNRLLNELESHPDAAELSAMAAPLAKLTARYIDNDDSYSLADRWSQLAGLDPADPNHAPLTQSNRPGSDQSHSLYWNLNHPNNSVNLEGIVPGALGQASLTPQSELEHIQNPDQPRLSGANWDPTSWVSPVTSGGMLFTNDGITISCFDRFTLRPIWRLQTNSDSNDLPITPDSRARLGRIIEDATTITVVGDELFAPAGIPRGGSRTGDNRLVKLNAITGQILWAIDIHQLDQSLSDASIRGPVIVDEGVVVVGARTNNRKQRLISLAIIGLDSTTGELKWIRQIASAGSLPFQQIGQLAHCPVLHDGTIYWTDHIGLGFSIEASTGHVNWARSLPPPDLYARFSRPSYSNNTPVITDHGMFTLSTDGTQIFQLDRDTGETIAVRPAEPVGESLYLLAVDNKIACVSPYRVTYFPAARFATGATTKSAILGSAKGIRGRVVAAGNRLIVPVDAGVEMLDPSRPQSKTTIELDAIGNINVVDGQILVVDEMNVSSFLAWETASSMLDTRIDQDPASAITLAELAFRAGRASETLPAINRATTVIQSLPFDQRTNLNDQLFTVILDMVEPMRRDANSGSKLDAKDQREILDHLGALARSHQQVVAHRMALGAWLYLRSDASGAIRAYQDILDQPALSSSMWEGSGIAVRGGLEATRRIGTILDKLGYEPYREFNQLAQTERNFLNASANPSSLEQLAKRYPWSTITPTIWLDVSNLWNEQRQTSAAINAASEGIDAAHSLIQLGMKIDQNNVDQLAERAITGMIEINRAKEAESLASSLIRDFPNLTLRIAGEVITRDQITQKAIEAAQLPVLGDAFIRDNQPILLTGSPIKPSNRIDQGGVVLYAPQLGKIEYYRAGRNVFEPVWSRKSITNEVPEIPWQDETRTLILWPEGSETNDTGTLEAIETSTGRTVWSISNIRTELSDKSPRIPDELARLDGMFTTPTHGPVPINQLVVTTDGHTIVVTDRVGRAMGVDIFSGKTLWQSDLPTNRVHDINLASGVLGVCGLSMTDRALNQREGSVTSIVASIDPRTGQTIQVIDRFGQLPRWVRVGIDGNLYVATTERIVAINTKAGEIDWVLKDENLAESTSGWIIGDQLLVLADNTEMWTLSLDEGTRSTRSIDLRGSIGPNGWVRVQSMINSFIITGSRGLVAFDHNQRLIASDPINAQLAMVDVAFGAGRVVYLESPQSINDQLVTQLYLLEQNEARLLDTTMLAVPSTLDRLPTSITAITGGVIVGYNEVSVFVRTHRLTQ